MPRPRRVTNPFRYGDLALDDAFTDREDEVQELKSDMLNGQNVVIFAPRRYGKSSLLWRVSHELIRDGEVLVAQVDLMKTPTKEKLAEKLASSIYDDVASTLFKVREKATEVFKGLRVAPVMTLNTDGSLSFSFRAGHHPHEIDATIERLLELPAQLGAERRRRVALVFDEFQEIVKIDRDLLPLMRVVFQEQPEVSHVYLGSKRHMMEEIFNDDNEPFWRSARQVEMGAIPAQPFAKYIRERFRRTSRTVDRDVVDRLLKMTRCHPYGTQELAYTLWEVTEAGGTVSHEQLDEALARVLRAETAHFQRVWEEASRAQRQTLDALAREPAQPPLSAAYRRTHGLPGSSTVQRTIEALVEDELLERDGDGYRIAEPFLAEWILRYES